MTDGLNTQTRAPQRLPPVVGWRCFWLSSFIRMMRAFSFVAPRARETTKLLHRKFAQGVCPHVPFFFGVVGCRL